MKSKIANILEKDKLLHLIGGVYGYIFLSLFLEPLLSLILMLIIGCLIEIVWDGFLKKGTPEALDAIITALGALSIFLYNFV